MTRLPFEKFNSKLEIPISHSTATRPSRWLTGKGTISILGSSTMRLLKKNECHFALHRNAVSVPTRILARYWKITKRKSLGDKQHQEHVLLVVAKFKLLMLRAAGSSASFPFASSSRENINVLFVPGV
ncbi:hypothetical protein FXO37_10403 [Capsicum annuum]|nr:hypothetical protein FXO37_10403 [Capsicum annuum]